MGIVLGLLDYEIRISRWDLLGFLGNFKLELFPLDFLQRSVDPGEQTLFLPVASGLVDFGFGIGFESFFGHLHDCISGVLHSYKCGGGVGLQ